MAGKLSLTKHYVLGRLVREVGSLRPGMMVEAVQSILESPHTELADDLFSYDQEGHLLDTVLLQVCRTEGTTALQVIWVSLVAADRRLQRVLSAMSSPNGSLDESFYSTTKIEDLLLKKAKVRSRKAASNLAHYLEQARIFEAERHGSEIVGASDILDTGSAVPICLVHLAEVFKWGDPLNQAVKRGAHSWLNQTRKRFIELATSDTTTALLSQRADMRPSRASSPFTPKLHLPYVTMIEKIGISTPEVRQIDPEAVENATREHRETQNELAMWAQRNGFETVRPDGDPLFDVGWWGSRGTKDEELTFYVAEVKSLGADNEVRQLRLGLGQVLDYRKRLRDAGIEATAVLAAARRPLDHEHWSLLAADLGVVFCWPPFIALDEWVNNLRNTEFVGE